MLVMSFDQFNNDRLVLEMEDGRVVVIETRPGNGRKVRLAVEADKGVTILRGRLWNEAHPGEIAVAQPPRADVVAQRALAAA